LLATGSKDGSTVIWKITKDKTCSIEPFEKFEKKNAEIWRVEWNITGTILGRKLIC
jgi:hypothetical protein